MRNKIAIYVVLMIAAAAVVNGQPVNRDLKLSPGQIVEIVNLYGRVDIVAAPTAKPEAEEEKKSGPTGTITVTSNSELAESEIKTEVVKRNFRIVIEPLNKSKRIDISLSLPERTNLVVETRDGEIRVEGNFESVKAETGTGTIAVDVPTEQLEYDLWWTTSKPRVLADFALAELKERSAGRFQIKGRYPDGKKAETRAVASVPVADPRINAAQDGSAAGNEIAAAKTTKTKKKKQNENSKAVSLNFTTTRGIVLLNVPMNEVMSDLRERPLTEAAKAIVRSGDFELTEAIRRASPKYFGDYAKTLPPAKLEPKLTAVTREKDIENANISTATTRVLDEKNRAIGGLTIDDFEVTENGESREIISVKPVTAPVNLVLLLDVSGSVDNYVNFIRKAARAFVNTVDANDRVSIVIFNDDVKVLGGFTTDKAVLSERLDSFDAGGGTAYYDAIGYSLVETLRPLKGERTAIVVLTDGDDNRSFLPFDSLAGTIEESGALIYPLYVPSSLAALGANQDFNAVDPLRQRYLNVSLTSKANGEGAKLAQISGGVYYPITQLSQIQAAYEDIATQLRTAYDVTFRSKLTSPDGKASPRLKIHSKKPNTYTQIGNVTNRPGP
ncbi:MAG: VWA domain-containing protein [Pyrinomonadaceae bacterium]